MSMVKVVAVLAVLGVLLFDAGAVLVNRVQADEVAQTVLRSAVTAAQTPEGRLPDAVVASAQAGLTGQDEVRLDSAVLDANGLTVVISKDAKVLVLDRLGPLAGLATATVSKTAAPG